MLKLQKEYLTIGKRRVHSPHAWVILGLVAGFAVGVAFVASRNLDGISHLEIANTSAAGSTYYVSPAGSDSNTGTEALPFKTIQKAADIVNPGDTVIVEDGTYTYDGNPRACTSDPAAVCLIRGGTAGNLVTFKSRNKWGAKLNGQNYQAKNGVTFRSNYIRWENFEIFGFGNAGGSGGGMNLYGYGNNSQLIGNHIHHIGRICTSTSSGQVGIIAGANTNNILVEGNLIHDIGRLSPEEGCANAGDYENHDHGLYISWVNNVKVYNNVFYNHTRGWAIHAYNSDCKPLSGLDIMYNTFAFPNHPSKVGHIIFSCSSGGNRSFSNVKIQNNIFYQPNVAAIATRYSSYTNTVISDNIIYGVSVLIDVQSGSISGITTARNNFTNPLLVNPAGLDFHLQSTSPAINTALNVGVTTDFDGNARPQGGGYDVGAYEYGGVVTATVVPTPTVTPTTIPTSTPVTTLTFTPTRTPTPTPTPTPTTAVTVTPTPTPTTAQPDYISQNLASAPGNILTGQSVSFSGTIRNSGFPTGSATSQTRLRLDVGNNGSYDTTFVNQSTTALAVNASEVETWSNVWTAQVGTHRFEICADVTGLITESSETNNCSTQTFTVFSSTPSPTPIPTATPTFNPGGIINLLPTDDAYVRPGSSYANTNYGSETNVKVDGYPIQIAYLKFDLASLAGRSIQSAKLRVWVNNSSISRRNVRSVLSNLWSETTITYNNRPATGSTILSSANKASSGKWFEFNLTSAVTASLGQKLSIEIDSSGNDGLWFYSKERSTRKPMLVIQTN